MNALSTRAPWTRGVLMALWPLLVPLVWVTQIDSCEGHAATRRDLTGIEVFSHFDLEGWLVASAFGLLLMSFLLTFTVFDVREPRAAGLMVQTIFASAVLDALLRVVWSIREWLRARVTSS